MFPGVFLTRRRDLVDRLGGGRWLSTGTRRKVELESAALHERYELWVERSQDDLLLRELFSPSFVSWLAEHPLQPCFEYRAGTLVVYLERRLEDAGHLGWLLDATAEIARRLRARSARRPARAPPDRATAYPQRRGGAHAAEPAERRAEGGRPREQEVAGLAHVATVSFLASRATPSIGFWVALAGGVALARAGARRGLRWGYGASVAAMLQTVAMIGPVRFGVPLTQALTAPLLGVARGARRVGRVADARVRRRSGCFRTRSRRAFVILVLTGLDVYTRQLRLDRGRDPAAARGRDRGARGDVAGLVAWAVFASVVQVWSTAADCTPGPTGRTRCTCTSRPRAGATAARGALRPARGCAGRGDRVRPAALEHLVGAAGRGRGLAGAWRR